MSSPGPLGWPNVPATVLRDGPYGIGSVQRFVPFDPEEHYFTLGDRFGAEFRRVAAFDLVVNNADRKAGHCLLGEDGRIYVVDHGVCFSRGAEAPHGDLGLHRRTARGTGAGGPAPARGRRSRGHRAR